MGEWTAKIGRPPGRPGGRNCRVGGAWLRPPAPPPPVSPSHTTTLATPRGLVAITGRAEAARRKRSEDHRQFLADHWAELSAAAFEGYRRHGAGAVVLRRDAAPRRFRPRPFEPERLWYTTQIHAIPGTTDDDFDGWEARQLEAYDPQSEGLVVFVEGKALSGYRVAGDPAPPVALRLSKARSN